MDKTINITLKVWRQRGPQEKGAFQTYQLEGRQLISRNVGYS